MRKVFWAFVTSGLLASSFAFAQDVVCMSGGQQLSENNAQVINWKNTTANQFHSRGHIVGTLVQAYPDHSGHHHLEVQIGANQNDTIEVIYNEDFGAIPQVHPGSQIEACGDYITSNKQSGPYPASPDGAIVHWVHKAPNRGHEDGFLIVDGTLCGQSANGVAPKPPRHKHP